MVGIDLKLRHLARAAFGWAAAAVMIAGSALAQTPEEVQAGQSPEPMSAWIAAPVGIVMLLLLIWALSKFVRSDKEIERQMREEQGDKPVIPVPDDNHHPFFH